MENSDEKDRIGPLARRHQGWHRHYLHPERNPYGFNTRCEDQPGTNPQELIGAAHAGRFSMALSKALGDPGMTAESIETKAEVTLDKVDGGFALTAVHLSLRAKIPGADRAAFEQAVEAAKNGCPVARVLNAAITLQAVLDA